MTKYLKYSDKLIDQLNRQIQNNFPHVYKITSEMTRTFDSIARMVMIDRYAIKDLKLETLEVGDLVIVKIKHDPKFPTLGTGIVISISEKEVSVEVDEEYRAQIDPVLNPREGVVEVSKMSISKPMEIFYEQIAKRVGHHLAEDEEKKAT